MVQVTKISKLFYREYPYKIAYKRLYGFPSKEILDMSFKYHFGYRSFWFDIPETESERQLRNNCLTFLKSFDGVKFANSSMTHVYFKSKDDYNTAKQRYKTLQLELHEPFLDDLPELLKQHNSKVDIKNKLYHGKYRYKVVFKCDAHFIDNVGPTVYELYKENENYHLNPNIRRFSPGTHTVNGYRFNHSYYNVYSIYCKEQIDMELVTFVASENITSITKAVLIDELDK